MSKIESFEDLEVWQRAREIASVVFLFISKTEFSKDFELKNQANRSSGSIMDNIAEGFERGGNKELIHFLFIAKASSAELKSQMYRALDRNHITKEEFDSITELLTTENKKIGSFISYLRNSEYKGTKFKQ